MATVRTRLQFVLALASLIVIGTTSAIASAAEWHVEGYGLDTNTCGPSDPCRSIHAAIQVASDGDVVSVGPGVYGDLNQNAVWGEPGEEAGEIGYGCNCVVKVDKAVTIRSTQGAAVTRIDARDFSNTNAYIFGVHITASGAVFGEPGHGFQITDASYFSVIVEASNVRVTGNISAGTGSGFWLSGTSNVLDWDVALTQSTGFLVTEANNTVTHCVASGSRGFGFETSRGSVRSGPTGVVMSHDVSIGNQQGFNIFGSATLNNIEAVGNIGGGIVLRTDAILTVKDSNIVANGALAGNCGVINQSAATTVVSNSFWGAPTGPGAPPANSVCDDDGSTTTVPSVAPTPFRIPVAR
jgi:hypothetical protein